MKFKWFIDINNLISFYVELLDLWLVVCAACCAYDGKDAVALVFEALV